MEKLPGSLLFLSAAVFLVVAGSLDITTFLAVIACAVCSAISLTNKSKYALIGGIGLISTSFVMQVALNYKCLSCIKADILILSAVICLSICETGKFKLPSRVMSGAMMLIMLTVTLSAPLTSESSHNLIKKDFSQYLEVNKLTGEQVKLNTAKTPVILFSASCPACKKALEEVTTMGLVGNKLKLVLTSTGKDEINKAVELLNKLGYTGSFYTYDWHGPVPTVVYTENNKTLTSHSVNDITPLL